MNRKIIDIYYKQIIINNILYGKRLRQPGGKQNEIMNNQNSMAL